MSPLFRAMVQAAAAKTRKFAAITGLAAMRAPYAIHRAAPSIWQARSAAGFEKK